LGCQSICLLTQIGGALAFQLIALNAIAEVVVVSCYPRLDVLHDVEPTDGLELVTQIKVNKVDQSVSFGKGLGCLLFGNSRAEGLPHRANGNYAQGGDQPEKAVALSLASLFFGLMALEDVVFFGSAQSSAVSKQPFPRPFQRNALQQSFITLLLWQ
jgi:hypothetical protein